MKVSVRPAVVAFAAALLTALPAVAHAQAVRPLTVNLTVQNASGVAGSATLTDIGGGRTRVEVRVSAAGNTNMPAHIHDGTCATLNPAPKLPLTNVTDGTSTTEVNATIATLTAAPHAINLHKSPTESAVYVSCGNVVAGATALPATGGPASAGLPVLAAFGAMFVSLAGIALRRR
jgi:hypothetical protein